MQLDYRQYLSKLEKITPVEPQVDYVDTFIKAYYLPEADFEAWLAASAKKVSSYEYSQTKWLFSFYINVLPRPLFSYSYSHSLPFFLFLPIPFSYFCHRVLMPAPCTKRFAGLRAASFATLGAGMARYLAEKDPSKACQGRR